MLQESRAEDFVIATGHSHALLEFVECAFTTIGKKASEYVEQDLEMLRPSEIKSSYADVGKAARGLRWSATHKMPDVVRLMLEAEL